MGSNYNEWVKRFIILLARIGLLTFYRMSVGINQTMKGTLSLVKINFFIILRWTKFLQSMEQIKANALFKIKKGKLEEFKQLIPVFIATVKEKDPGTLTYDWYLNEGRMECTVLETYTDSEAVLAHARNVGELLQSVMQITDLSAEIYGNPSEELKDALEGLAPKIYPFYSCA